MADEIDEADGYLNEQLAWGESSQDRILGRLVEYSKKGRGRLQAMDARMDAQRDEIVALRQRVKALEDLRP